MMPNWIASGRSLAKGINIKNTYIRCHTHGVTVVVAWLLVCATQNFEKLFAPFTKDPQALDLMKKMLVFNPAKRITVDVRARPE